MKDNTLLKKCDLLINKKIHNFKKGYYRPVSMPLWKWIIVMIVWAIAVLFYFASVVFSTWLVLFGILFQIIAISLTVFLDTESWKNTKEGKDYLNKYYK